MAKELTPHPYFQLYRFEYNVYLSDNLNLKFIHIKLKKDIVIISHKTINNTYIILLLRDVALLGIFGNQLISYLGIMMSSIIMITWTMNVQE